MKRLTSLIMAGLAAVVGWFVLQQAQTNGWKGISLPNLLATSSDQPPPNRGNDTIRIATFNIQVFGESKLNDSEAMQAILRHVARSRRRPATPAADRNTRAPHSAAKARP